MVTQKQINIRFPKDEEHLFHFLKRFETKALKENWTRKEIDAVFDKAFWYSYHHILNTILEQCLFDENDIK